MMFYVEEVHIPNSYSVVLVGVSTLSFSILSEMFGAWGMA